MTLPRHPETTRMADTHAAAALFSPLRPEGSLARLGEGPGVRPNRGMALVRSCTRTLAHHYASTLVRSRAGVLSCRRANIFS